MKSIHTPMQRDDSRVYLAGNAGGFDLRNCPDYKQLAEFIKTACNAHDQLVAENATLRADLNDARSNWESGAEELRQADLVRDQLVAALRAMLETQPNANDGRTGGHQSVTAEDVAACRQARAALTAAGAP